MAYRCKDCRKHFSVRTGTVLAESRLPLLKWLLAIYMLTSARKGIPSTQMARELGVTQKTTWFLAQRIRETWMSGKGKGDMGDKTQVDETYVGGKEKINTLTRSYAQAGALLAKPLLSGCVISMVKFARCLLITPMVQHWLVSSRTTPQQVPQ